MDRFLPRRAVAQECVWLLPKDSLNKNLIMNKYEARQNKRKATETHRQTTMMIMTRLGAHK